VRVRRVKRFQGGAQEGWLVEFEWSEGGKTRKGVAPITDAGVPHDEPWYFEEGGLAVVGVAEDKTIDDLATATQGADVRAFEAAAVTDVRTIMAAEAAYRARSGGTFGELRCLARPAACIPGSKEAPFVAAGLAGLADKTGYRRRFYPGAKANGGLASFAYTAVPVTPGETGTRGFCGDDTGRICFTADGTEPPVVNARCAPAACASSGRRPPSGRAPTPW
jgi:hypothetical protein